MCGLLFLAFVFQFCVGWQPRDVFVEEAIDGDLLKAEVLGMFSHGWDAYKNYAGFEKDELKPLSCSGHNSLGGLSTTLIDSLDMLAIVGDSREFTSAVNWIMSHLTSFDFDTNVSVFETNIRILGGLLSAHMICSNTSLHMYTDTPYDGKLLLLAVDLANRLVAAFDTPSGLPYGTVNLRHGVPPRETKVVCAACCSTFALEFGTLSLLTGNVTYWERAKDAVEVLWSRRIKGGLLATHLEVENANWVLQATAGLGGDTDSAYEYFYKAGVVFDDARFKEIFKEAYESVEANLRLEGENYLHYVDHDISNGMKILNVRSLSAFWPGVLTSLGKYEDANRTIHTFASVFQLFGFLPECVCVTALPHGPLAISNLGGEPFLRGTFIDGYPLRPELIESVYHLYHATRDPSLLKIGLMFMQALRKTRVTCGYCSVHGVLSHQHTLLDQMDSFALSETFKYLYLLWDLASSSTEKNWVNRGGYVFTTEAHLIPIFKKSPIPFPIPPPPTKADEL